MFNDKFTEYQNFVIFSNKIVFHARISDFEYNFPNMGFEIQKIIDYNEILEKKRISLINWIIKIKILLFLIKNFNNK